MYIQEFLPPGGRKAGSHEYSRLLAGSDCFESRGRPKRGGHSSPRSAASGVRRWAFFCDLTAGPHFPPTGEGAPASSSFSGAGRSFKIYVAHFEQAGSCSRWVNRKLFAYGRFDGLEIGSCSRRWLRTGRSGRSLTQPTSGGFKGTADTAHLAQWMA